MSEPSFALRCGRAKQILASNEKEGPWPPQLHRFLVGLFIRAMSGLDRSPCGQTLIDNIYQLRHHYT